MSTPSKPGRLFIISGPSGVGKTTVWQRLAEMDSRYRRVVTCTTRAPRPGEQDGVDYHFLSPARFDELVAQQAFAEWMPYGSQRYGSLKSAYQEGLAAGYWIGAVIEVKGAAHLRRVFPSAHSCFIHPPTHDDLRSRLVGRGDVDSAAIEERLAIALEEMQASAEYDFHVTNDVPIGCAMRIHRWALSLDGE